MSLITKFCLPVCGQWVPENGWVIPDGHEHPYHHEEAQLARAAMLHQIPVGIALPLHIVEIVHGAFRLRAYPEYAETLWRLAREQLADAADEMTAAERIVETVHG